jgi:hypothetical protein
MKIVASTAQREMPPVPRPIVQQREHAEPLGADE